MNDDFAFERVPVEKRISGLRIAVVVIGINIALPAFMTGAELGFALGFHIGAISIVLGGIILSLIGMATGTVGARTGLNTAMITKHTFGSLGGRIVTMVLVLSCLGWFGVTAEMFGRGVYQILADQGWNAVSSKVYVVVGGVLMVVTTIYGFSALRRLSNFTVPLLAILIAYTAYVTMRAAPADVFSMAGTSKGGLDDGVSAIVGGLSVAVTIFPDFCRFSRSEGQARMASLLAYGVAISAVVLLAMVPSIVTHERDLMVIMTTLGLGLPALLLLVVKAWATNSGNLYSAALSAATMLSSRRQRWIIVIAGLIGIAFAIAGLSERFVPFLVALGISIPPIAGIYVADFLWLKTADADLGDIEKLPALNYGAFACWALGIAIALAAREGIFTLTGIAACDAMIVAALGYTILRKYIAPGRAKAGTGQ